MGPSAFPAEVEHGSFSRQNSNLRLNVLMLVG